MAFDPFGLLEAEAEDERHWRRFASVPVWRFWAAVREAAGAHQMWWSEEPA